jgi:hypothetical protein
MRAEIEKNVAEIEQVLNLLRSRPEQPRRISQLLGRSREGA